MSAPTALRPRRYRHRTAQYEVDALQFDGTYEASRAALDWLGPGVVLGYEDGRLRVDTGDVELAFPAGHKVISRVDVDRVAVMSAKRFHVEFTEVER